MEWNIMFILLINNVLLLSLSFIISEDCPVYTCQKLKEGICSEKQESNAYLIQECPHNTHCSFDKSKEESLCLMSEYEYNKPTYPGGKCLTSIDCLSNNCINNICQGLVDKCKDSSQCPFNTYCNETETKCQPTKLRDEDCTNDYECHWSLGCYNNKCTSFFSIENGEPNDKSKESLCKSGLVYNGQCNSINDSLDTLCSIDKHCNYIDSSGKLISIENTCVCSIGTNPLALCKRGDINNPYWMTVIKLLKGLLSKEDRKCNAMEKKPGFCREELRNDWNAVNTYIELTKSKMLFEQGDRLTETAQCGLKSILGFDDTPPLPKGKIFQCPIYNCIDNNTIDNNNSFDYHTSCANSTNPFNEQGSDIEVSLRQVCNKGYRCNFNKEKVFLNWTTNSTCEEIPTSQSWSYKFPGEECINHDQCNKGNFKDVGYCINGFCSGHDENAECKGHNDCLKGFFCNGKYCQEQKGEQHFCLESFECLNYLGCLNNTCVRYYSLPNGTFLNSTNPDPKLCQMGQINSKTNQCAIRAYYGIKDGQMDEDGFVECSIGQLCNYTTGFLYKGKPAVTSVDCECGYSASGKSFCPLPQTLKQSEWKQLFTLMNKRYDNDCHTLRRHVCLNEVTFKDQDKLNWYKRKTVNAYLFRGENECIIRVLLSFVLNIDYLSQLLSILLILL